MRSHWKHDDPLATKTALEADFEKILPPDEYVYIRPVRLSELPPNAETGVRYYGAFDSEGDRRSICSCRTDLVKYTKSRGFVVQLIQ